MSVACLLHWASAVRSGVRPEHAALEIVEPTDPPRVQAMVEALRPYGHLAWCRDRARTIASVLMLGGDLDPADVYSMLCRVNGGHRDGRFLMPPSAADEVLAAWRGEELDHG